MAPPDSGPATDGNAPPYSVSELAFALKRTLETTYGYVRLRGELSKVTRHSSGHVYLSIKDDKACIDGVVWKTAVGGLKARPEQGMEVIVTGRITTYPASSKYQIVIESLEPAGVGALLAQLEKLKDKLQAEGLFEPGRKRRPPRVPATIGVITSPTGAVIRDILHRVRDRWPCRVIVWPVVVQGEAASAQVANAIRGFCGSDRVPRPDVLIVARGGGSVEDLWPFNDEALARAVAECSIPLISAVGHETDTTLIDYVADLRAPTPTGAAEMATPVLSELKGAVLDFERRTGRCIERALEIRRTRLSAAERGLPRPDDLLAFAQQRFDGVAARLASGLERNAAAHERALVRVSGRLSPELLERPRGRAAERVREFGLRLDRATERMLADEARRLAAVDRTLRVANPELPLERGFALVSRAESGELVRSGAALKPGEALRLKFRDATRDAVVDGAASPSPPPSPAAPVKKPARAARPGVAASALQPDLF